MPCPAVLSVKCLPLWPVQDSILMECHPWLMPSKLLHSKLSWWGGVAGSLGFPAVMDWGPQRPRLTALNPPSKKTVHMLRLQFTIRLFHVHLRTHPNVWFKAAAGPQPAYNPEAGQTMSQRSMAQTNWSLVSLHYICKHVCGQIWWRGEFCLQLKPVEGLKR